MSPIQTLEMPIPFGISDDGMPLPGLDDASLQHFSNSDDDDAGMRDYLDLRVGDSGAHRGVVGDIRDPNVLAKTGWAVLFAPSVDTRIREALAPLIDHRKAQVVDAKLFHVFEGAEGYLPNDTAESWLGRTPRNVRIDIVRPSLGVPYYFLIVGPPHEIPFEFQYSLDLYWAVGRLWFETAEEFRQYADSVVRYETMAASEIKTSKQMAVFAPCHDLDPGTQQFSREVATTMVTGTDNVPRAGVEQGFAVQPFIGPGKAMRDDLSRIFRGAIEHGQPALLLSGGHGKAFGPDKPDEQAASQGALICQDWQGVGHPFTRDHYFDASNLPADCKTHGMIHFLFACYGGGWPATDTYNRMGGEPKKLAERQMLARLPQALLAQRDGGALAVVAHIDRAWAYSFRQGSTPQIQGFSDVIAKLMWGDRVGLATDQFNMRWAGLSNNLAETLQKAQGGLPVNLKVLANQWIARDDARNYVVFGDPAVRLRVDDMPVIGA